MNKVLFLTLFLGAFFTMYKHGVGRTFAYWLLPAIVLFNFAKSMAMPGLPNITSVNMVLYGTLCALPMRWGEIKKIRWNLIDSAALLVLIPVFVTTLITADPKLAQRETMETFCRWLFPYFMARVALQDADGRRATLKSICVMTIGIGFFCAVEVKFRPYIVARVFERLQWSTVSNDGVLGRWGLLRAMVTSGQPIDLGCLGVLTGTLILILTPATGSDWRKPMVLGGILASGAMVFSSISMTAWGALVLAFVFYYLLSRPSFGKYLALPILLIQLGAMLYLSNSMLNEPVTERPEDPIAASKWIRVKIIQDAWPQVQQAGWFGAGAGLDVSGVGVGSVDNSYLMFIMQTGWFSLIVWLLMLVIMAVKGSIALAHASTASERFPVAAALAGLLAIVFAMYTVFFGFTYAIMFHVVLGMLSTMYQMLVRPRPAAVSLHGGMLPHGFPAVAGGVR